MPPLIDYFQKKGVTKAADIEVYVYYKGKMLQWNGFGDQEKVVSWTPIEDVDTQLLMIALAGSGYNHSVMTITSLLGGDQVARYFGLED